MNIPMMLPFQSDWFQLCLGGRPRGILRVEGEACGLLGDPKRWVFHGQWTAGLKKPE